MKHRRRLFRTRRIFDLKASDAAFLRAMKENVAFHRKKCPAYRAILDQFNFNLDSVNTIEDLYRIPPLPTSYLKNNTLLSKPYHRLIVKTTSSGTSGKKTLAGFDVGSGLCEISAAFRLFKFFHMLSPKRTNYIVLGAKPDKNNQTATAKALSAVKILAPAKRVEYALTAKDGEYTVNTDALLTAMSRFADENRPVRIIGLPAYFKLLLDGLTARGIRLTLHQDSKILLGGGWKALFAEEVSKAELFACAQETLGIRRGNFLDHFSTAEHPISYLACKNFHFHIPAFSRVIIRDVDTLAPVPFGVPGLLNLITPILSSLPFGSILTDDIAVMRESRDCGCGIDAPYFELIGRVGLSSIKTCAQTASVFLNNI